MTIEWTEVESSNIAAVGSEVGNPNLYVRFTTGAEYVYYDVGEDVVQEFLDADSQGKYFNEHIKGAYEYRKISG